MTKDPRTDIDMIRNDDVRERLTAAYGSLIDEEYEKAVSAAAEAFAYTKLAERENAMRDYPNNSSIALSGLTEIRFSLSKLRQHDEELIKRVNESLATLSDVVEMIGKGVDYREYRYWLNYAPEARFTLNREKLIVTGIGPRTFTSEIATRCLAFALSTALKFGI